MEGRRRPVPALHAVAATAENVAETLTKGARVIVTGRLEQRSYDTREGESAPSSRSTSRRSGRPCATPPPGSPAPGQPLPRPPPAAVVNTVAVTRGPAGAGTTSPRSDPAPTRSVVGASAGSPPPVGYRSGPGCFESRYGSPVIGPPGRPSPRRPRTSERGLAGRGRSGNPSFSVPTPRRRCADTPTGIRQRWTSAVRAGVPLLDRGLGGLGSSCW